jgi:cytoskeletal protein RodZ
MTPVPRKILAFVAFILGGVALFGLASGLTTALQRSGPPTSSAAADGASGPVAEAVPLQSITPPPPVPEEEEADEEEEKKDEDAADQPAATTADLTKTPQITPPPPPPSVDPAADATGPLGPPPAPVEGAAGPALY